MSFKHLAKLSLALLSCLSTMALSSSQSPVSAQNLRMQAWSVPSTGLTFQGATSVWGTWTYKLYDDSVTPVALVGTTTTSYPAPVVQFGTTGAPLTPKHLYRLVATNPAAPSSFLMYGYQANSANIGGFRQGANGSHIYFDFGTSNFPAGPPYILAIKTPGSTVLTATASPVVNGDGTMNFTINNLPYNTTYQWCVLSGAAASSPNWNSPQNATFFVDHPIITASAPGP